MKIAAYTPWIKFLLVFGNQIQIILTNAFYSVQSLLHLLPVVTGQDIRSNCSIPPHHTENCIR